MEIGYFRCPQPSSQAGRAVVVAGRANDDDAVVTSGVVIYLGIYSDRAGWRVIYSARGVYAAGDRSLTDGIRRRAHRIIYCVIGTLYWVGMYTVQQSGCTTAMRLSTRLYLTENA